MGYRWCSNHSTESWSLRLSSLSRFVSLFSLLLYYSLSVLLRCASFYIYHHFVDISDPPSIPHPTSIYRQFDGHLVHHRSQSPLSRRFIPYPHISLYLHLSLLPLLRLHPLVEDHLVPHHNPSYLSRGSLLAGVKVLSMALCVYLTKQNATTPRFSAPPPLPLHFVCPYAAVLYAIPDGILQPPGTSIFLLVVIHSSPLYHP